MVVGTGYRFGYKAQGDTSILAELGQSYGLDIHVVPLVTLSDGQRVSSSRVRELLAAGHMEPICELLGRRLRPPPCLYGFLLFFIFGSIALFGNGGPRAVWVGHPLQSSLVPLCKCF